MTTPRIIFACLAATLSNFVYAEFEPILALRLEDYDTTTIQKGMCMSIYGFVYIIGTLTVPHIPETISKRFTLIVSSLLMGIFLFLVGPSKILGFEDSLTLMIVGLFITANFLAPLVIPVLPEMIEAAEEKFSANQKQVTGDYTGALLSTFLGLGQVLGPLFGATTYAQLGFKVTQDIMAIICIVFAIIYFFVADGKTSFKETFKSSKSDKNVADSSSINQNLQASEKAKAINELATTYGASTAAEKEPLAK